MFAVPDDNNRKDASTMPQKGGGMGCSESFVINGLPDCLEGSQLRCSPDAGQGCVGDLHSARSVTVTDSSVDKDYISLHTRVDVNDDTEAFNGLTKSLLTSRDDGYGAEVVRKRRCCLHPSPPGTSLEDMLTQFLVFRF